MPCDETKFIQLLELLGDLVNLSALSLPNSIDVATNQEMCATLNTTFQKLKNLKRLNLSYCNLHGQLEILMGGLKQRMIYLNLKDTRLNEDDMFFLVHWRPLASLRELNLSCNNLKFLDQVIIALLERMKYITCFCLSFCSLSFHSQALITRECKESGYLKVFGMQNYVPLADNDTMEMLHICSQMASLQKIILFPEVYAFPGTNEEERRNSKMQILSASYRYLARRGRLDMEVE